ncbi:MAG: hypothetical protein SWH61_01390 [Thermodesulfobacteriota bacterium]|nr:hypothetical protein [Thermodesulfobacteriota bacterium]
MIETGSGPGAELIRGLPEKYERIFNGNRPPTVRPKLTFNVSRIEEYPGEYESFFNDNFGLRQHFVDLHDLMKFFVLRDSPRPNYVLRGKEGWLFFAHNIALDTYRRNSLLTDHELNNFKNIFHEKAQFLEGLGIKFIVIIYPQKATIYPEYMPSTVKQRGGISRMDQVIDTLQQETNISVLDLRDILYQHKSKYRLFHKVDTHLNYLAGFFASVAVADTVSRWYPEVRKYDITDYSLQNKLEQGGDLARMANLQEILTEEVTYLTPRFRSHVTYKCWGKNMAEKVWYEYYLQMIARQGDKRLPRAMMFGDSFIIFGHPFLSESFDEIRYIVTSRFSEEAIMKYKPNVVIWEIVERNLMDLRLVGILENRQRKNE